MMLKNAIRLSSANKRLRLGLAAGICTLLLAAAPAFASTTDALFDSVDESNVTHNEEQIDLSTGEAVVTTTETEDGEEASTEYSGYDTTSGLFLYSCGSGAECGFTCNVADGMFTNHPVQITVGEGLEAHLFRNGYEVTDSADLTNINLVGSYSLSVSNLSTEEKETLSFRIIANTVNANYYMIPEGFTFTDAYLDGEAVYPNGRNLSLETEGTYEITITCDETQIPYSITCTADHTAPTLALEGVDEKGIARQPIDLSDLEENAAIYATRNGEDYEVDEELTLPGTYQLIVQDEAGNSTTYNFTLRQYFTISSWVSVLVLAAIVIGVALYAFVFRKRFKVR